MVGGCDDRPLAWVEGPLDAGQPWAACLGEKLPALDRPGVVRKRLVACNAPNFGWGTEAFFRARRSWAASLLIEMNVPESCSYPWPSACSGTPRVCNATVEWA
jgi:hypothetical protein